ncbi:Gustatory receptor 22a [Halyomorpha halys]|nr:Gustatory receptor 22a [Halyomorpha halys]
MAAQAAAVNPTGSNKEKLQIMFRISAFSGLFPFIFSDNDLIRSPLFILHCILSPMILFLNIVLMTNVMDIFMGRAGIKFNKFVYQGPLIATACIPAISIFWLSLNLKRFSKVFRALRAVENVTQNHPPTFVLKPIASRLASLLPLCIIELFWSENYYYIYFYSLQLWIYIVILQFTSILTAIRSHYSFLENTLSKSTATEWTQCHEVLGACCEIVNRCYSPQSLIYVLTTFGCATTSMYGILIVKGYFSFSVPVIIEAIWIISVVTGLLHIVYNCDETVQKAKNFDKSLYRLVLNDSSKLLLRNKRIMYHFQAKRKVEFSAMGFFNFDYSLICRMVSTATTYIVIMVQFSG